jgi:hypothetical protein
MLPHCHCDACMETGGRVTQDVKAERIEAISAASVELCK